MATVTENDLKDLKDLIITQNQKIDNLTEKINNLAIGQARLEETGKSLSMQIATVDRKVEKIDSSQDTVVKDVADLKGVKSLIVPIIVAVTTSLLTLLIRAIPNP